MAMSLAQPDSRISIQTFQPRRSRYCAIVGVWNEGERFTTQLARMLTVKNCPDIIVADGGSTDGATSPSALSGKVQALIIDKRKHGLSGQYRAALAYALERGYDGAIMIDGNGKDGVEALPQFIRALEDGADFVQGSRFLPGGSHLHTPATRYLGIRFVFNPMMAIFCGHLYSDGLNGFKGVSRAFLEHPGAQPFRDIFKGYSLQYYFNYRAPRLKLRIVEIPVHRDYPRQGATPTKITGILAWLKILRQLVFVCLGRYNPPK